MSITSMHSLRTGPRRTACLCVALLTSAALQAACDVEPSPDAGVARMEESEHDEPDEGEVEPSPEEHECGGDLCADWKAKTFTRAADQTSAEFQDLLPQIACDGPQYVRFDAEQKLWVGLVACESGGYRFYLADAPDGTYLPATDSAGHGQDFCELVDPTFTLGNEDDITSGSCPTCAIGVNVPLEGIEVYVRSVLGEPFERLVAPFWHYQTAIVSCDAGPRECVDRS